MENKKIETPSEHVQGLAKLRDALLHLHKTLLDFEKGRYEQTIGKIQSPNHFLRLLTNDPWFAWLHPLSELIVTMDEAMEEKEPLTAEMAGALKRQASQLLVAGENAEGFPGHYDQALQADPAVVMAHSETIKLVDRSSRASAKEE